MADAMGVRELFGFHDVDVFVDGDAVGPGEAHGFDVLGGVAADEEGGGHTLFAHGGEELRVGFAQEGFEHVRGDLRDKRVHGGNDVAPGLDVVVPQPHGRLPHSRRRGPSRRPHRRTYP